MSPQHNDSVAFGLSRRRLIQVGAAGVGVAATGAGVTAFARQDGVTGSDTWHSEVVYPGEDGKLVYETIEDECRIPDFSWAGYHNGEKDLPEVPVAKEIEPVDGDNTEHIQAALDEIGAQDPDDNGFRGALLLKPGQYDISGGLKLNKSGVVLRGSGDTKDPAESTIINSTASADLAVVVHLGNPDVDEWETPVEGTTTDITTEFVQVGSRSFEVGDASLFEVGDNIIVRHDHTPEWNEAVDKGGIVDGPPWDPDEENLRFDILYNRYIKDIEGDTITICAPVFNHLNLEHSPSYIYKWDNSEVVREVGVENLRVRIEHEDSSDDDHANNAVQLSGVEDAWVRDCTLLHFRFAGVHTKTATRCTILDTRASHPASPLEGSTRYNFNGGPRAQQILFKGLHATHSRHAFATSGCATASGIVWTDGYNLDGHSESGGHRGWSNGLLFDNIKELNNQSKQPQVIGLYNGSSRNSGLSHGWSTVHSVAWNCTVEGASETKHVVAQKPPTAQNFAIGTTGEANAEGYPNTPEDPGHIEGTNKSGLEPASLYEAQLKDRLG